MSTTTISDEAKSVVRRNTEEVQGRRNFDVVDELFADDFIHQFIDISLNQCLRRVPPEAVTSYMNLGPEQNATIPSEKELVLAG